MDDTRFKVTESWVEDTDTSPTHLGDFVLLLFFVFFFLKKKTPPPIHTHPVMLLAEAGSFYSYCRFVVVNGDPLLLFLPVTRTRGVKLYVEPRYATHSPTAAVLLRPWPSSTAEPRILDFYILTIPHETPPFSDISPLQVDSYANIEPSIISASLSALDNHQYPLARHSIASHHAAPVHSRKTREEAK